MCAACTSHDDAAGQPTVSTAERIPLEIGIADTGAATATRTNTIGDTNTDYFNSGQLDGATFSTEGKVGVFVRKKDGNASTDNSYEKNNLQIASFSTFADNYSQLAFTEATSLAENGSTTGKLYYPEVTDQQIDIYAYAPWQETQTEWTNISTQTTDITLQLDQTAIADYKKSDVLWGCSGTGANVATAVTDENGAYKLLGKDDLNNNNEISANKYIEVRDGTTATNGPVANTTYYYYKAGEATRAVPKVIVPMLHRGAKVIVKLTTHGMDQNKLRNATVRMQWPYRVGTLNVSTGEFIGATNQNFAGDGVLTSEADNSKQAWQYVLTSRLGIASVGENPESEGVETTGGDLGGTDADDDDHGFYTCTGIVVPGQSLDWDNLFEVDLYAKTTAHTDGAESDNPIVSTYSWKPTNQLTLKSGKQYTFEITITADQMTVALQVEDWVDGTVTGTYTKVDGTTDVSQSEPEATLDLSAPEVGDLYFSDGTWGSLTVNTSGGEKTADDVIGIVFSTETSAKDQALGYRHGYVMALNDAVNRVKWSANAPSSILTHQIYFENQTAMQSGYSAQIATDLDGLTYTNLIRNRTEEPVFSENNFPSFWNAVNYNVNAPSKSSGWYLPSVGQLCMIVHNILGFSAPTKSWGNPAVGWPNGQKNNFVSKCQVWLPSFGSFSSSFWWSSTQYSVTNPYSLYWGGSDLIIHTTFGYNTSQNSSDYASGVRPVLAF